MLAYIVVFAVSIASYAVGIRVRNKILFCFFLMITILLPAILGGLRDPLVGKDFSGYGCVAWNSAVHSDSFYKYSTNSENVVVSLEIAYLALNYIVSRFFSDFHVFFFVHQFLLMSAVVFVACKCRKYRMSEFVLLFYFFSFYNESFNYLKQSISLVAGLIAVLYLVEEKNKTSFCAFFASCLAHRSAYFFVFIYVLKLLIEKYWKRKFVFFIFLVILFAVSFSSFTAIMNFLIANGLYSEHYSLYIDQIGFKTHKADIGFLMGVLLSLSFLVKKKDRNEKYFEFTFFVAVSSVLFHLFGSIVEIAARVALYYELPLCILLLVSAKSPKNAQKMLLASSFCLILRWLYLSFVTGYDRTIPYSSQILGI